MGFKVVEITRNINNAFGPGTAKEHTVQWWFKNFCKGDESLEYEEHSGWPLEVDNHQLTAIIEADPLTTTQEVAEEFNIDHSMVIQHLKQIGKVKKLNKWVVPHAAAAKALQSCPTLCNSIDGSPTGSALPGILQARTLEWVAISFSNA